MLFLYILLVLHAVLAHDQHWIKNKIFYNEDDSQFHFEKFLKTHKKVYDSESERETRFNIFKENLLKINELNSQNPHAKFAVNQFADISSEEFSMLYTGFRPDLADTDGSEACRAIYDTDFKPSVLPKTFDWRNHITMAVKSQMACGSCWAFAVTANVEAQYSIVHNKSVLLSEQQIVDCSIGNNGCGGGIPTLALRYLAQVGGQESSKEYPYYALNGVCQFKPDAIKVRVFDCITFRLINETMIQHALVNYGPLVLCTTIDSHALKPYDNGVLTECSFKILNHAVLLVGYGTDNGQDFWVIKNSWGNEWGENGFFRIQRNVNACGMLNPFVVTSVIVNSN